MSLAAVVYVSDAGGRQWALSHLAGRSVLLRMILTAVRAGVREIGLPRPLVHPRLLSQVSRRSELAHAVFSLEDRDMGSGPILLLPAHAVVDVWSLAKLCQAGESGMRAMLEESKGTPVPILVMAAEQARPLRDRLVAGAPIGAELETLARGGGFTPMSGSGYFIPVTDRESLREAEATLYRSLGTEADSFVDTLVNRRCSRILTRVLLRLQATPNVVTLLGFGLGLLAAWQFWFATPGSSLLGLLLYLLSVVADHSDGDIARLTFQESTLGQWLDVSLDNATHALLVLAMAATATVVGGPSMYVAGGLAAIGIVMSAVFTYVRPPRPAASRGLGRVLARLGNRDPFYLLLLGFIFLNWKAQAALPWLVWLLAVGSQAYWLSCLAQKKAGTP